MHILALFGAKCIFWVFEHKMHKPRFKTQDERDFLFRNTHASHKSDNFETQQWIARHNIPGRLARSGISLWRKCVHVFSDQPVEETCTRRSVSKAEASDHAVGSQANEKSQNTLLRSMKSPCGRL
jgi:hypothetical protein